MVYVIVPVVALVCGVVCLSSWRRKWLIDDTPTSTCRGVFVGRNEVVGRAVPFQQSILTPFTQAQAVWLRWRLEHYVGGDDGWKSVDSGQTAGPFWMEDDTGRVLVRPRGAEIDAPTPFTRELGADFAPPYSRWQLQQWVLAGEDDVERERRTGGAPPAQAAAVAARAAADPDLSSPISQLKGKHRVTEWSIPVGAPLYLLGTARPRTDATGLEFVTGGEDLLVSTNSESKVARSSQFWTVGAGLLCLLTSAVFVGMVTDALLDRIVWAGVLGIVLVELAVLFLLVLQRNYNRQVAVKEQAALAWSMIDVSLRRRADLLPQLVAVVDGYANHEQSVLAATAKARTAVALPDEEELPSDATLAVAEESDRTLRAGTSTTVAIGESYPDLKSSQVFLDLQRRIADAEESVASARGFYNDAIEVLRNRRRQFPGSLFARLVKVPSWNYFEGDQPPG